MNRLLFTFSPVRIFLVLLVAALSYSCAGTPDTPEGEEALKKLKVPKGFTVSLFAANVPGARSLTHGPDGIIFVSTRNDKVYAVTDFDNNYKADEVITLTGGLRMPNGIAFRNGSLYVAEVSRVLRYDNIATRLKNVPAPVVIRNDFPTETHHGWKFIAFGPDGKLYIPVGAPCNVCNEKDYRYASILRMDADGKNLELYASGVRNTVGFDWHPQTKHLWFTDNGRDMLGDDIPADEVNIAAQKGNHYGFPFLHASNIKDPEYGKNIDVNNYIKPVLEIQAHSAALGCRFYTGNSFPQQYKNALFIAEHGSWNRSKKVGYRVSVAIAGPNGTMTYQPFLTGFLRGEEVSGRPVDVLVMKDGSLLVSDDYAGCIYRISYSKN